MRWVTDQPRAALGKAGQPKGCTPTKNSARRRNAVAWLLALLAAVWLPRVALADGGRLLLSEQRGEYRVSIFVAPVPLRAGPIDVSVLVQNATTGTLLSDAQVDIRARPIAKSRSAESGESIKLMPLGATTTEPADDNATQRSSAAVVGRATSTAATNKLLKAAQFELPRPGRWRLEVHVDAADGPALVQAEVTAAERLPRWQSMWPWFTWPALVVGLFCVHQWRASRRR